MPFETEPLALEPLRWIERQGVAGILLDSGEIVAMPTPELAATMQKILDLSQSSRKPPTFQQLALQLARWGIPLAVVRQALEILCQHKLIKNDSAYRLVETLRETFRWPESLLGLAFVRVHFCDLPVGYAARRLFQFLAIGLLIASPVLVYWSFSHRTDSSGHPWRWLLEALVGAGCARSMRSLLQAGLLRGLTGQRQELEIHLGVMGPSIAAPSVEQVENRTAWEGWAGIAALAPMPIAAAGGGAFAAYFALFAMLTDCSPFTSSPLSDLFRYFHSLRGARGGDRRIMFEYATCAAIWLTAAVALGLRFARHVAGQMRTMNMHGAGWLDTVLVAILLTTAVSIAIAWIEDVLRGLPLAFETDADRIRALFRFRPFRSADRARKTLKDFNDPGLWNRLPVLRQLEPSIREALLDAAELRMYPVGRAICRQNETKRELFVLLSGEAIIVKRDGVDSSRPIGILEEHSLFGETGFFLGAPRTADVIAMEDSVVLAVRARDSKGIMDVAKFTDLQIRIWLLQAMQSNPMFRDMPTEAADFFAFQGRIEKISAGTKWINEGESATNCFFIIQGAARVFQSQKEIRRLATGDIIGEIALFSADTRRTASVIAETDVLAVSLDFETFWQTLTRHFAFGLSIERMARGRLEDDRQRARRSA